MSETKIGDLVTRVLTHSRSSNLDSVGIRCAREEIKRTQKPTSHSREINKTDLGKDFIVNNKTYRVCPRNITGSLVLVNKRGIAVEVLVLTEGNFLLPDKTNTSNQIEKPRYVYEGGTVVLYSSYNSSQKADFDYYSGFFK